jgi:ubiquinone/menaquinone biosynthesis C-methylase UbiE
VFYPVTGESPPPKGRPLLIQSRNFDFDSHAVASGYDRELAPVIVAPWAARLLEEHGPWENRRVLDLATGTGVVARLLATRIGPRGEVVGADINGAMLALARRRCAGLTPSVQFVESPACPLDVASDSSDFVVCQQGFQFFPDKLAAAREIHRVLCDGGRVVASTWRPVAECDFFGAICHALESIGEHETSEMMRIPFDHMPESELRACFEAAGFMSIRLRQQRQELVMEGGVAHAIRVAYSTPIGPKLRAMPEGRQTRFRDTLAELLSELSDDGTTMGEMVSSELYAQKATRGCWGLR